MGDGPATADELRQMLCYLEEGLDAGAFGISTGLEYPIEVGSAASEVEALLEPVARHDLLYLTHTRRRDWGGRGSARDSAASRCSPASLASIASWRAGRLRASTDVAPADAALVLASPGLWRR